AAALGAVAPVAPSIDAKFLRLTAKTGDATPLWVGSSTALPAGTTAYVFCGTTEGSTLCEVGGLKLLLPVGGQVWQGASTPISGFGASISTQIPSSSGLGGATLSAVVVLVFEDGTWLVSARTGGPVIQDALA
ncbi:MAG TPA: hypothetical protein VEI02_02625, partial [Planctomycetota bacterium]|nr:hypothetical protein [Planctomycetota bacterium]